jgi:sporulation protein YlmC with PRC-barrel domain
MDDPSLLDPVDDTGRRPLPPVDQLVGLEVRADAGERVGSVAEVVTDTTGERVRRLVVGTGWFGKERHLVPVDDVRLGNDGAGDFLVLPYGGDAVRELPVHEP